MSISDEQTQIVPEESPSEPSGESPGTLLLIAAIGFVSYWVFTPVAYQFITGRSLMPTTQPTTQSSTEINPHDLVALSIACPIVGLLTLTVANIARVKHPFQKLGLTWTALRQGGWLTGLVSAVIVVPTMFGVVILTQKLWEALHYAHPNEHDLLRVLGVEPSLTVRVSIVVSAILLAPAFEEMFFRGMVQRAARLMTRNRGIAIVIASLAFTAIHGALWLAPPIFFLSLCLGYLYERTRNLWVPIIVHAAFNASSVVMFLFFR